jgi:MFS family permease
MTTNTDSKIVEMLPAEKRTVGVITLIAMMRMFGLFALLPVLSLYAATLDGATPLLVGLTVGAYGLTQAGLQVPFGALSDRIGRVPVIVAGLVIFAVGSIVAAVGDSIWTVITGRFLQGAGAISATLTALIADATRIEVRTRSMAFIGVFGFGLSFLVAILVGPIIAAYFGVPALFGLAALLAVVAGVLLKGLPDGIERPATPASWDLVPAFRPDLLRLDLYIFLLHTILVASFVALPFLLANTLELAVMD